jgi:small subunit ribosomal protein S1
MFESGPRVAKRRQYRVGEVLSLEVVRVTSSAVFLALDGKREGYVDAQELLGPDGEPTVDVGARLAVKVAELDRTTGDVRLSPVSPLPLGPEAELGESPAPIDAPVVVGMRVKTKVVDVERYGVFVELVPAADAKAERPRRALIPGKELGAPRGADLHKAFPPGTELEALVVAVDERKRIRLSVVALKAADERRDFETFAAKSREGQGEGQPRGRAGFGTFADLMKRSSR